MYAKKTGLQIWSSGIALVLFLHGACRTLASDKQDNGGGSLEGSLLPVVREILSLHASNLPTGLETPMISLGIKTAPQVFRVSWQADQGG